MLCKNFLACADKKQYSCRDCCKRFNIAETLKALTWLKRMNNFQSLLTKKNSCATSVLMFSCKKHRVITPKVNEHSNKLKPDHTKKDFQCKFCDKKFLLPMLQLGQDQL